MKILQIHKYFWHKDGASNYAWFLSELLRQEGHTVVPFSMQHDKAMASPYAKYFVSNMELGAPAALSFTKKLQFAGRMLYSFEAKKNMRKLLDAESIDMVHVHNIYHHISPSILGEIKKRGIPIVMTLHDYKLIAPNYTLFHHGAVHEEDARGWYGTCVKNKCMKDSRMQSRMVQLEMIFHHKIMKFYEKYVDRFIAPSEFIMDTCIAHGWPKEKFIHIPHAIDSAAFKPSKKTGEYVAYAGRLAEEKGLHVLLEAAVDTPEIPYKIIGDGPLMKELRARVKKQKIQNVVFTGFKTGEDLQDLLEGARLFVVPSLWYENYPLSVLEPKALGKVVIGSNIGGIPELLPEELLTAPGDGVHLAAKIESWYTATAAKRKKIGATLRKDIESVNDPATHVAAITRLYNELLSNSR